MHDMGERIYSRTEPAGADVKVRRALKPWMLKLIRLEKQYGMNLDGLDAESPELQELRLEIEEDEKRSRKQRPVTDPDLDPWAKSHAGRKPYPIDHDKLWRLVTSGYATPYISEVMDHQGRNIYHLIATERDRRRDHYDYRGDAIVRLYCKGLNVTEIAKQLHYASASHIVRYLNKLSRGHVWSRDPRNYKNSEGKLLPFKKIDVDE